MNITDPDFADQLAKASVSTECFGRMFMPERFYRPINAGQKQILSILDNPPTRRVAIAAPRGFGKTSWANVAYPARKLLFRQIHHFVSVSSSNTFATANTENLKSELETNENIKKVFGSIKSDVWAKDGWETTTEAKIIPRGAEQQMRGLLYRHWRPDQYLVDDLENPKEAKNEDIRAATKKWFYGDLLGSIDRSDDKAVVIVIGTIVHSDSLLQNLLDNPDWYSVRLDLCDDNFNSNYPEHMSSEKVKALRNEFERAGELDTFYMEYRNLPIPTENQTFTQSMFKYYNENDFHPPINSRRGIKSFVLIDPARSTKKTSNYTAIVGVSIDLTSQSIYVRDIINKRLHPQEQIAAALEMAVTIEADTVAIEDAGLVEFATYPLQAEIAKRRMGISLVVLKPRGKHKLDRIESLAPLYRQGRVLHNKANCGPLETQLLTFPKSKNFDVADCFSYIVELLSQAMMYFDEEPENIEAEYQELANEDRELESLRESWELV